MVLAGFKAAVVIQLFLCAVLQFCTASGAMENSNEKLSELTKSLPRWKLERHFPYTSAQDTRIDEELQVLEKRAEEFKRNYRGRLNEHLADAVVEFEELSEALDQSSCYLTLVESVKKTDPEVVKRKSAVDAVQSKIAADNLTFFQLELAALDEAVLKKQLEESERLRHYKPYIDKVRKTRPHVLNEDVERALNVRAPWSSSDPVVEYYGQQLSRAKFRLDGDSEEMNLEVLLSNLMSSDPALRRAALKALNSGLESKAITRFASLSLNVVAGSWHIEMMERGYLTLRSRRNLSNDVSDEVVTVLLEAVRTTGVELSKRYYRLKKKILKAVSGLQEFSWADRNAPLGLPTDDRLYSWDEAQQIVKDGYKKFSPRMADMFVTMVKEERIDMPAVDGKDSGAFCHGCTTKTGPFQLNNYTGNRRDIETLAHESGHGCHNMLAYKQGYLQYHPPLTLAETASIFGEMIVFRDLLEKCRSEKERLSMLMSKLDSIINSVTRQCSFDYFEELVHTARAKGVVGDEEFPKLWMQATVAYYGEEGEVFDKYEDMENLWSYVSHFHAVPFYVYAYAFADLLVGSLYNAYKTHPQGFEEKLLGLLAGGSTKDFVTALKPFGLDPSSPEFWTDALTSHLGAMLGEAEAAARKCGYL
ncbi:peptidase family m3 protein [Cystoisospora suis]|uniref:Peptidase family m3 protein n=1 Tax=Cystoisospora suis TaxID=483139 RepID=A0A2C6KTI6_9APIC|nr:peptidase family m3 protein [Cystoisospora suis]